MTPRFRYALCSQWPPLAWVARMCRGAPTISVYHGSRVELADDWFCEAVWDGPFADGSIDRTDIVAGTGARLREGKLTFVSSGTTVDRLQWVDRDGQILVSNSLVGLLRLSGESLIASYRHYQRDFFSIVWGLRRYQRTLPASGGPIELCYFDNLVWNGDTLRRVAKPCDKRRFENYSAYDEFLRRSMGLIASNMSSSDRTRPYEFLGTLSTGYDSTAITALAKDEGLRDVLCFSRQTGRDLGSKIAHYFGVNPIEVDVDHWLDMELVEIPFIAGNCFGEEVQYAPLQGQMSGKVLLTGFHGDKIWSCDNPNPNADIVRGDASGGALTEFRLHAGFIHCAVPFWGVRDAASLLAISRSEEMRSWDVAGDYSRPICRRIVESIGVPREAFGQNKSFAARWYLSQPDGLPEASRRALVEWLDKQRPSSRWRKGRLPSLLSARFEDAMYGAISLMGHALTKLPGAYRMGLDKVPITGNIMAMRNGVGYHPPPVFGSRRYVFPWAVEEMGRTYPDPN